MTTDKPIPETITLERTGQPPLRFDGTLLATACGQFVQNPKDKPNADYFTVSLFEGTRDEGREPKLFIVQIVYRKDFRGTTEHHSAIVTGDPAATLSAFDPLDVLIGFPPGEDFAERQTALENKLRRQYDLLVSAVLKDFPETLGASPVPEETITLPELEQAASQLGRSEAGRASLRYLLDWLDDTDINLDGKNQEAVFTLLEGYWGSFPGTARDVMRDNL